MFSLGAVLVECMTGQRGSVLEALPKQWKPLLEKATDPDPANRFQSGADFLAAVPKPRDRTRQAWAVAALVTLALLASVAYQTSRPTIFFPPPVPFTSLPGEEVYPSFSPDGEKIFFAWSPEHSGQTDIYVKAVKGGDPVRLSQHPARETAPACSRDGKLLAFFRDEGHGVNSIVVSAATGGQERVIARGMYHSFSWAPDNRSIAVTYADPPDHPMKIRLVDIQSQSWRDLTQPPEGTRGDQYPAFSPDGRFMVFSRVKIRQGPGEVYIQEHSEKLTPVGWLRRLTELGKHIDRPNFTSDGKGILFAAGTSARKLLWYVPANGSAAPVSIPEAGDNVELLRVSSASPRLAFSRSQADMNIWRVDLDSAGGAVVSKRPIISSTWDDEEHKLSPDGALLAFISQRSGREQVWLSRTDGAEQRQLTRLEHGENLQVYWAPEGTRLLLTGIFSGARRSHLISMPDGILAEIGAGLAEIGTGVSRDGKSVYFHSARDGQSKLWQMALMGGEALSATERQAEFSNESVDGKTLFFCSRRNDAAVWQSKDGYDTKIIDRIAHRAFAVGRTGIYYLSNLDAPVLRFYRFADGQHSDILKLEKRPGFGLDVSADEKTVFFSQLDHDGSDLMLIDAFRLP